MEEMVMAFLSFLIILIYLCPRFLLFNLLKTMQL